MNATNSNCNEKKIKALKGAREYLERLDDELGPRLFRKLRDAGHHLPLATHYATDIERLADDAAEALRAAYTLLAEGPGIGVPDGHLNSLLVIRSELERLVRTRREASPDEQKAFLKEAALYVYSVEGTIREICEQVQLEVAAEMKRRGTWETHGDASHEDKRRKTGRPPSAWRVVKRMTELKGRPGGIRWSELTDTISKEFHYEYAESTLKSYWTDRASHRRATFES